MATKVSHTHLVNELDTLKSDRQYVAEQVGLLLNPALTRKQIVEGLQALDEFLSPETDEDEDEFDDDTEEEDDDEEE